MSASFEIRIFGICLCFYKDGVWNVIFPCDSNHEVKLCFEGQTYPLRRETRLINIELANITSAAQPPDDPEASPTSIQPPFFNMAGTYAHGYIEEATGGRKTNLKLRQLKDVKDATGAARDFVWLRVPGATRMSRTESRCDYYVQDVSDGRVGLPPEIIAKRAREIVLTFQADRDIELELKDDRVSGWSEKPVPKFSASAPNVHLIEIDNDCHENCPPENDFLHLYWIVEDIDPRTNKHKNFAAGQIRCKKPKEGDQKRVMECVSPENREKAKKVVTTAYGNCDPVESIPPAG